MTTPVVEPRRQKSASFNRHMLIAAFEFGSL